MVRIKRVYDRPSPDDGERILVDRLWPRGLARDSARIDLWLKVIAPSVRLRQWFHGPESSWRGFRLRYLRELGGYDEEILSLKRRTRRGTVTLLYASRDTEHNHAVVLKEAILGRRRQGRPLRASGPGVPRRRARRSGARASAR